MIEHMPFILIALCSICDFWLMSKVYKANEFISWSESIEDIDNVISQRVFIKKMELDTFFELLKLNRIILAIALIIFYVQSI